MVQLVPRKSIEDHQYAFAYYIEVTRLIDTAEKILEFSFVRLSTDDDMEHSLRRATPTSQKGNLFVVEWFCPGLLDTLHVFMNMLRAKHPVAPFSGGMPCPLPRSHPKRFCRDFRQNFNARPG